MTLLSFEDVEIWYVGRGGTSPTKAVSGISLDVRPGELVAIVGESGSGKSTLILSAIGLLPRSSRVEGGRILLFGNDVAGWSPNKFARYRGSYVGFVPPQDRVSRSTRSSRSGSSSRTR